VVGKKLLRFGFQFGFAKKTPVFDFTKSTAISVFFSYCVLLNVYSLFWVLSRSLFYHCFVCFCFTYVQLPLR